MARFEQQAAGAELDPIASERLDALGLTFATDAELAAATAALAVVDALKQDAATAATDAELADAVAGLDPATILHRGEAYGTGLWTPGRWYLDNGNATAASGGNNAALCSPLRLVRGQPIDALAFQVVVAGEAGGLLDFALYEDGGRSMPGPLVQSWLGIDGTVVGLKQLDLAAPFTPTRSLHWVVCRWYNAPTTRATIRSTPSPQLGMSVPTTGGVTTAMAQSSNNGFAFNLATAPPADGSNITGTPGTAGVRVAARAA